VRKCERRRFKCQEETVQVHEGKAPEQAGALDEAAAVAGWAAVELVWVESASAPIAATGLPIRQVPPATRFSVLNVGHQ